MDVSTFNNATEEDWVHLHKFYQRLYMEAYTIIGVFALTSNALLITAICKFKKLQEVTNIILAHFNGLQAVYFLASPIRMRIFDTVEDLGGVTSKILWILNDIETSLMFCMCLFLVLLLTDWYIKVYKRDNYGKFSRAYPFVIALIYLTLLCLSIVAIYLGIEYRGTDLLLILIIMSFVSWIFLVVYLIVLNIIHQVRRRKLETTNNTTSVFNLGLNLANITVLLWVPIFFICILNTFIEVHALVIYKCILLAFTSPIFHTVYLYLYEPKFHIFLKKIVTCKCNEYTNERLEEQSVAYVV